MFIWGAKKPLEPWKTALLKEDLSQKLGKTVFSFEELKILRNRFITIAHPSLGLVSRLTILQQPEFALNPLIYAAVDVLLHRNIEKSQRANKKFTNKNNNSHNTQTKICNKKEVINNIIKEEKSVGSSLSQDDDRNSNSKNKDKREKKPKEKNLNGDGNEKDEDDENSDSKCLCGDGSCIYTYDEAFLSFEDYIDLLSPFHANTPSSTKLKLLQRMIDVNEDGFVSHEEVEKLLCLLVGGKFSRVVISSIASEIISSMESIKEEIKKTPNQKISYEVSNSSMLKMASNINPLDLNKGEVRTIDLVDVIGEKDIVCRMTLLF